MLVLTIWEPVNRNRHWIELSFTSRQSNLHGDRLDEELPPQGEDVWKGGQSDHLLSQAGLPEQ